MISPEDKYHNTAKRIFELIDSNELKGISIPSSAFLEYELVLKSQNIDSTDILKDILHFQSLNNISEIPLDSNMVVMAIKLREKYGLTYFDSLHCATALSSDGICIGTDQDFKQISALRVINPKQIVKEYSEQESNQD